MNDPIKPDHVRHLKSVGDPCLSPNGARLAYTLSWVNNETLESQSRVMMMDLTPESPAGLRANQAVEFTQGSQDGYPKFSPDGNTLAFLRTAAQASDVTSTKRQIWLIASTRGEARQLT